MKKARTLLEQRCFDPEVGALTQAAGVSNLDASALLPLHFGFFDPNSPEAAFTVCSFWLVEALAIIDRKDQARELFERLLSYGNPLGLFSEDILPATGELSGNFPQTYSHVGLINSAFRLSRSWG